MTLLFSLIIFRVIDIQYLQGNKYRKISKDLTRKPFAIEANKGNVYASDGNLLATSMSKFTIRMDVMSVDVKIFDRDVVKLSRSLASFLGKSPKFFEKKLRNARKSKNRYILIAKDIGYNDYMKMKQFPIFKLGVYKGGFIAEHKTVRAHPIGKIAERTIGYHDNRGDAGIEGAFVDYLKGEDGLRWKQKIAKGQWKPINDVNEKEPVQGYDVVTTLDVNIQDITHHALLRQLEYFEADHGCAVVMETATGEIKAISNLGRTSAGKYYEKRNYAVWEAHEPGSTFKLINGLIALEENIITSNTKISCNEGHYYSKNRFMRCHCEPGTSNDLNKAIYNSCNTYFATIYKNTLNKYSSSKEGMNNWKNHVESFGLGNYLGYDHPLGRPGLIPDAKYYDKWYPNNRWRAATTISNGIGQGEILTTPIQLANITAIIANRGWYKTPHLVKKISNDSINSKFLDKKHTSIKSVHYEKIINGMFDVIEKGTAQNSKIKGIEIAGKTGTAENFIKINGKRSQLTDHSIFIGFAPKENPKIAIAVFIENGYWGTRWAAPIASLMMEKYLKKEVKRKYLENYILNGNLMEEYLKPYTKNNFSINE